jgi:polysaccharide export outer membrane protein
MTTALFVLLLCQSTSAPPQTPVRPPATTAPAQPIQNDRSSTIGDYRVGAQDVLNITVLNAEVFNEPKVPVDNDGMFQYLDVGRLKAAGLSVRDIQAEVRNALIDKGLHTNPTVVVDVAEFRSQVVYVQGAVRNIGSQKITGNRLLISVLADAGWPIVGSGSEVIVTRKPDPNDPNSKGGEFHISRKELETGTAQFNLQDQDIIMVPEAAKVILLGEVHTTGPLDIGSGDVTLLQLIGIAGGLTDRGSKRGIEIQRVVNGKATTFKTSDLTTLVKPGDTVTIHRRIM